MAILSSLLAVSEPSGVWISIIKAFEAVTNKYVLAIIFLTVVVRVIVELISIFQKVNSAKMNDIMAKSQPELEKVREKYANKPEVLKQKENEINKKYYGNKGYIGGCLINLVTMIISFVIFWTLFPALNSMAAYKTVTNYENLKYTYANCLNVVDQYYENDPTSEEDKLALFGDYKNLKFVIESKEDGTKTMSLVQTREDGKKENVIYTTDYKTDFSEKETIENEKGEEEVVIKVTTNKNIINLVNKYFPQAKEEEKPSEGGEESKPEGEIATQAEADAETPEEKVVYIGDKVVGTQIVEKEDGTTEEVDLLLTTALASSINVRIVEEYDLTQDSFLWIQNIWIADSPANKSIASFATLNGQVGGFEEGEEAIYDAFMPGLKAERNRTNGYFILTILCIAVPMLNMLLTKFYNRKKLERKIKKEGKEVQKPVPATGMAKWLPILLPIVLGVFTLLYNSMFSIYLVTGQIVTLVLSVPIALLVDFIRDKMKKKEKQPVVTTNDVDYSRKF